MISNSGAVFLCSDSCDSQAALEGVFEFVGVTNTPNQMFVKNALLK